MTGHDQVFCLLGTTRAKSGKEGFVKVDKGLDKIQLYHLAGFMLISLYFSKAFHKIIQR